MHHPNEPAAPEAPRRRYRKLRIAWSVAWGVVAVLLIALWVRSYWWDDMLKVRMPDPQRQFMICSMLGGTRLYTTSVSPRANWNHRYWRTSTISVAAELEGLDVRWPYRFGLDRLYTFELFSRHYNPDHSRIVALPHWMLVVTFTAFAVAPWVRWRFSLRTLLIATTLVAVVLGAIIALNR
jgi:hypothetical protein